MTQGLTSESAKAARKLIDERRKRYQQKYKDEDYWSELAKKFNTVLPKYYGRPSDQDIKSWLKKCDVSYAQFINAFGWKDAQEFEKLNPTHGIKPIAGLILQLGQVNREMREAAKFCCSGLGISLGKSKPPRQKYYMGKSKARLRLEINSLL